jgi:hypothetical protein
MSKVWIGPQFRMPERLYRYRPLGNEKEWNYLEQILLRSTMYGAPPEILQKSDPADCHIAVSTRCTLDEFKSTLYCQKVMQEHPSCLSPNAIHTSAIGMRT